MSTDPTSAASATHGAHTEPPGGLRAWSIWGLAAGFYLYEFFVRVAPSTVLGQIEHDLHATAAVTGAALGAYYYVYAPMQIVVGVLLDRIGPKLLMVVAVLLVACGCFLETVASQIDLLVLARLLQGVGSAFAFVTTMYLATVWFPHRRIGLITGLTTALGMLGAIIGNAGVGWLVSLIGWDRTAAGSGWFGVALGVLFILFIPKLPPWARSKQLAHRKGHALRALVRCLREVFLNPQTWIIGYISACLYLPLSLFGALWGNQYIVAVTGESTAVASAAVSMVYVGWLVGAPLAGVISERMGTRKHLLVASAALTLGGSILLLALPSIPIVWMFALLLVIGLSSSLQVLTFVAIIEVNPQHSKGTALAANNMITMLVGGLLQPVIGWLLDTSAGTATPTAADFRSAFIVMPVMLLTALVMSIFLRETYHGKKEG